MPQVAQLPRRLLVMGWPLLLFGFAVSITISPIASSDSRMVLAGYLNDFVIPHFPPLYPLFTRLFATGGTWHEPIYSALSIKLILLAQHSLTVLAAAYLADRLPLGIWAKRLVTTLLYMNPVTLFSTHSLLTEALVTPALFAAFAEAIPLLVWRNGSIWHLALFFLWVAIAALVRHIGILLGLMLPTGYVLEALYRACKKDRIGALRGARAFAACTVGMVVAALLVHGTSVLVMRSLDIEPRSILGRAFVYRLTPGSLGVGAGGIFVGHDEFMGMLERLKARAVDPDIVATLRIIETSGYTWVDPFNRVQKHLESKCPTCATPIDIWAQTDDLLTRTALYVLLTPDWVLFKDATVRTAYSVAPGLVDPSRAIAPQLSGWRTADLSSVAATKQFDARALQSSFVWRAAADLGIVISAVLKMRMLTVPTCFAAALAFLFWARQAAVLIFASFLTIIALAAAGSLSTVYLVRYGILLDQIAIVAVVFAAALASTGRQTTSDMVRV
jgi:hypothetical protein